ncbi:unnamed protein product [Staurois parvus]|uniref:Uncharacterized protein n=1 Tax=Staurois parvus TaxID=386267 RepID=A0ABN9EUS0_9NEOB|nr:unnamed protein product [Staurois parvus]
MMREWMSCLVVSWVGNERILVMLRRWSLHEFPRVSRTMRCPWYLFDRFF